MFVSLSPPEIPPSRCFVVEKSVNEALNISLQVAIRASGWGERAGERELWLLVLRAKITVRQPDGWTGD